MTALVFGRSGQVAQALARQRDCVALGRGEADITRPEAIQDAFDAHSPTVVINAAAYTAVDAAEGDAKGAYALNAEAPGVIAQACVARDIPMVHLSTDYVFDGSGTAPRVPDAPVGPLNVYGQSKLDGERAIRAAGPGHVILRTSWVFSADGANFLKTMLRLGAEREALSIVDDQVGGPTYAADIASTCWRIADALSGGAPGGTFHFTGAPDVSWAGFAQEIFRQAGMETEVTGIPSEDFPTPAARPRNSRLDCQSLEAAFGIARPDWRRGVSASLAQLGVKTAATGASPQNGAEQT
ncbi:MAG: dTDP-4-dehydrorhamnose reductase [Pseudomonadota bacterium]